MRSAGQHQYRVLGSLAGAVLGLGAPVGAFLLRLLLIGDASAPSMIHEFFEHSFFYVYSFFLTPIFFGGLGFALGMLSDHLSDRARSLGEAVRVMRELSIRDELTGLFNHRHLYEELSKELERSRRHGQAMCGLMIDLDNFKEINDRYGHLAGDVVLRECARVLKTRLRRIDVIGRYGGDEFLALLPSTSASSAVSIAERLRSSVAEHPFKALKHPVHLSVSVGLLSSDRVESLSAESFIDRADRALFEAKNRGRDRVHSYTEEMADPHKFKPTKPGESELDD